MLLREHPLMSRHNVCNWPPIWAWTSGSENKRPRGEIGIFKGVSLSKIKPADRCYLYIDHEGSSYIGCLLFDDPAFCSQIVELLDGYAIVPLRTSATWTSLIRCRQIRFLHFGAVFTSHLLSHWPFWRRRSDCLIQLPTVHVRGVRLQVLTGHFAP